MPLELQIQEREGQTRSVPLEDGKITLGRSHDNDLSFASDASLSRHHVVFEEDGDGWFVRDLESKNGTMLNGVRIQEARRVKAGDRVTAGHLVLVVSDPDEEPTNQSVEFVAGLEGPSTDTVMTSLQDVLSGERAIIIRSSDPRCRPVTRDRASSLSRPSSAVVRARACRRSARSASSR